MVRRSFLAGLLAVLSVVVAVPAAVSSPVVAPSQRPDDPVTLVTVGNWRHLTWKRTTRSEAEFQLGLEEGHAEKVGLITKQHEEKGLLSVTVYDKDGYPCTNVRIFDGHLSDELIVGWLVG